MSNIGDLKPAKLISLSELVLDTQDIKSVLEHTPNTFGYDLDETTGALVEIKDGLP